MDQQSYQLFITSLIVFKRYWMLFSNYNVQNMDIHISLATVWSRWSLPLRSKRWILLAIGAGQAEEESTELFYLQIL